MGAHLGGRKSYEGGSMNVGERSDKDVASEAPIESVEFRPPVEYRQVIDEFHRMWDAFPGPARLITRKRIVLAVNQPARDGGFYEGCVCAQVRSPKTHAGCKLAKMFEAEAAQVQRFGEDKIKGWMPVGGYPDLCVHYAVTVVSDGC